MEDEASTLRSHILDLETRSGARDVGLRRQYNRLLLRGGKGRCLEPSSNSGKTALDPCTRGSAKEIRQCVGVDMFYKQGGRVYKKRSRRQFSEDELISEPETPEPTPTARNNSTDNSVTPAVKDAIGHSTALLEEAKELYFTKGEGEKPLDTNKLEALKTKHGAFKNAVEARQALLDGGIASSECPRITQEKVCNRDTAGKCAYDVRLFRKGCKPSTLMAADGQKRKARPPLTEKSQAWGVVGNVLGHDATNRAVRRMQKKPYKIIRALYALKELSMRDKQSNTAGIFVPSHQDAQHGPTLANMVEQIKHILEPWTSNDFERLYQNIEWRPQR